MTTSPQVIGKIDHITRTEQHSRMLKSVLIGELESEVIYGYDPVLTGLRKVCAASHYAPSTTSPLYPDFGYVFSCGSAFPHDDEGMGLQAGVIVAVEPLSKRFDGIFSSCSPCVLLSQGQTIQLDVGDVFIFDADYEHAWMANCRWVVALQSIRLADLQISMPIFDMPPTQHQPPCR
jgi:hypothetical protein